jgi:pseudouridine-5'-phosphate glycosidase
MIAIAEEIRDALSEHRGVVALESTIIAHGLPAPDNLRLAEELEADVREQGAVPATIAVIDGVAQVGLSRAQLERLADPDAHFGKAGAADLPVAMTLETCAATTVSATSSLAAAAGIPLFATGGIGGVHRGDSADISADLWSLSTKPVAVVSAGPKAILDLPRTAEVLESLGVLVIGVGTDELPAFYCRESGLRLEHRVDDVGQIARILHARWDELEQGGVLLANPVPEEMALPRTTVDAWIEDALAAAAAARVSGKEITPFLLAQLARISHGEAVATNCALARSNARLAARVAVAYAAHSWPVGME